MPVFRIYTLGLGGQFIHAKDIECADDQEAIQKAQQAVDGHIEVGGLSWRPHSFLLLPHQLRQLREIHSNARPQYRTVGAGPFYHAPGCQTGHEAPCLIFAEWLGCR